MGKNKISTKSLTLCGVFSALTAILSQIAIPMTPVPINLATFSIMLAGTLLGWKLGTVSVIVYVALGAVGIPVFSGFRGGLSVLVGPTGGYIIGYVFCVFLVGIIYEKVKFCKKAVTLPIAMIVATFVLYSFGTAWYMYLTKNPLEFAMMNCVVPFLVGDALKIAGVTLLTIRLEKTQIKTNK